MVTYQSRYFKGMDTTSLHYQSWQPDENEPAAIVALVHGWSDHSGRYMNIVDHLVPHQFAIYALDLRGHGKSEGQRGHINSWDEYRNDIVTFVRLLNRLYPTTPIFLMGHSMGGLIVLDYIIHHPGTPLTGLIVSSPLISPPKVSPVIWQIGRLLSNIYPNLSLNPGSDPHTISRDLSVVDRYMNDPLVHQKGTPRTSTEIERTRKFVLANADAIELPFLMLYGEADGLIPPHFNTALFERVTSGDKTCHTYEGGYHETFNDICKDDVLADLLGWLKKHLA